MLAARPGTVAVVVAAVLVSLPGEPARAAETGVDHCLSGAASRVAVTGPDLNGIYFGDDGARYFASDLYRPENSSNLPDGGNETPLSGVSEAAFGAIALGPENRWGLVPALLVLQQDGAERLLQERELALGDSVFAPERISGNCADFLRQAELRAREDRLGVWSGTGTEQAPVFRTDAPERLSGRTGSYVIAQGRVVSLGKTGRTRYLNFGKYWKIDFTATLAVSQEEHFDEVLGRSGWHVADLAGKLVELRGVVQDRDGPYLELRNPEQLVVLEHPVFE